MISTLATIHISAQTTVILPAGFQVSIHNIGVDYFVKLQPLFHCRMRLNSVVGTATLYGLDGPGFEPLWGPDFSSHVHTGPRAYPAYYTMGNRFFFTGGKAAGAWR